MNIQILASGSSGNVALVNNSFLIDCGKPINWTLAKLNYCLPDAILITHEHSDHARAARHFLDKAVDLFLTRGTADALGFEHRYNLHYIKAGQPLHIGDVNILPFNTIHDAAEPVGFILSDYVDRVLFLTDSGSIPNLKGVFTKIFIEANYSEKFLRAADTNPTLKLRISQYHLSSEQTRKFLARHSNAETTLLHISQRHSNLQGGFQYVYRF